MGVRTDLALEEKELWQRQAHEQTQLPGVWARETTVKGIKATYVKILDERGAQQLHKPVGSYITLELEPLSRRETGGFGRAAQALAHELRQFLGGRDNVLVVGLGNAAVTPDAIGPETVKNLIVTRHLKQGGAAEAFSGFASVSAAQPGVLGATGVESLELVRGVAEHVKPEAIIVVDALAAGSAHRLCATIQLTDTGIVPGSGVQNARAAFNAATLGAPVIAVGVPTVVDAGTFLAGQAEQRGTPEGMVITPRDIDARVRELGRVIGYGINLALHHGLRMADVASFVP